MKRLLNRTAVLLLMTVMFMTLASASVCASDPVAAAGTSAAYVNVTEAALERDPVLHANTILANNTGSGSAAAQSSPVSAKKEMRGLWVATVVNIDYPSKPTTDPEVLKKEAIRILDMAKDTGLNAVFLQVRPTADAFYKSNIFPWSKFLTGTQGKAPNNGFDPLAFWIEEAHARGIELHAWINPFRVTKKTASEPKPTVKSLHYSHPARKIRAG